MALRRRTWLPRGTVARRSHGPLLGGTWLRLRTSLHASSLTRAIASGSEPTDSDVLSLRAGQLRSRATREGVAYSLRGAMRLADLDAIGSGQALRIRREAVCGCREALVELVERLEGDETLEPRGLAKAWLLVRDRRGPLFEPATPPLADEVDAILAALDQPAGRSPHGRASGA